MAKLTNEERAKLRKLADDYEKKIIKDWNRVYDALEYEQKLFVTGCEGSLSNELIEYLKSGNKASDYFNTKGKWLFEGSVLKRHQKALIYLIDNVTTFIFQEGWGRRSFRSSDYSFYQKKILNIIEEFRKMRWMDMDYADFLEDNLSEEQTAYKSQNNFFSSYMYLLTYEIDAGNERVIHFVKDALESGSDTAISYQMLSSIFQCKNTELHELVCKLLLAARLQEGLRQAICENCDGGRLEPFLMVLKTIRDNNLIRYSSIKRAVGCFVGLLTEESRDLERISAKSLDIIINCLEDTEYIENCFQSEDSMQIYIALWALGCREINTCTKKLSQIIDQGSTHQVMTAGIFIRNNCPELQQGFAVKAVLKRHEELDVMAVYLPLMKDSTVSYSYQQRKWLKTDMSERYSREGAGSLYVILHDMLEKLPKNSLEYDPCVFPWYVAYLTKSDIVKRLCVIASDLEDAAKIDETCVKIPLIQGQNYYDTSRRQAIVMLLSKPKTETQLDTLVSFACDKKETARKEVFKILSKCELEEKHFRSLEDMLRYKAADMRQSLIDVLFRQSEEQLFACIERLCTDKKEEKRTAGLDMLIRIAQSDRDDTAKSKYKALAERITHPSSKEQILIERILGESEEKQEEGYGLYQESDDFTPTVDEEFIAACKADFVKLFPETKLFGNKPKGKKIGMHAMIAALDELIEEHKNDEYVDRYAGECLLGNDAIYRTFEITDDKGNCCIAFRELWDEFYKKYIDDANLLLKLRIYRNSNWIKQNGFDKFAEKIYGNEFIEEHSYMHDKTIADVMGYYYDSYFNTADYDTAACALGYYIAYEAEAENLYAFIRQARRYTTLAAKTIYLDGKKIECEEDSDQLLMTIINDAKIKILLSMLFIRPNMNNEDFRNVFSIRFMLGKRFGFFDASDEDRKNYQIKDQIYLPFGVSDLILAAYIKIISPGFLYKMLMTKFLSSALTGLSLLISYKKSGEAKANSRFYSFRDGEHFIKSVLKIQSLEQPLSEHELTAEENKKLNFAAEIGENLLEVVLNAELVRGDTETEFSKEIGNIKRIYGGEKFVKILAAMGKDTLDRSTYFSTYGGVSKKQALSYLLGVCVPEQEDDAKKLRELLSATDVKEDRLVEAALFSTAWLDIIEEYIAWKGFKSACYYFIAHMNESIDEKTEAVIAKYTPLSIGDLKEGAFDVEWFKEAFQAVGEQHFDKIYKAAKYISSGAKHVRARKYADAVLGKLDPEKTAKEITDKRNKDTLMAYALIPLKNEDDMVERYLFIQEFKKQSKKFGAQRKASEGIAVDRALQNLATNAGFSDVSRLTLRMETKLFENVKPLLDWNEIDEIRLKIEIDDNGKAEIICEKKGKVLKSIPAKYKKNETVLTLKETKKQLTEQYRRTRQMFEDAMENETIFTAGELNLLCTNLAIKPIVTRLVYKTKDKLGFLDGKVLRDFEGQEKKVTKNTKLKIAHPYDLYIERHWHEYQKYLFDHAIRQPFKQVFRELYIKTAEEVQLYQSPRYAGNQIQPAKTKACLKNRHWVADVENGLQKVYYKENIIASIFALADWFSPADIEAPSLEWVGFFDRKTYKPIKIADVPDIIFSEVMRDVDLAVSVAHAGAVDPETSHSTIEMRKAIIEFTLPLFKLRNVQLEGSHAFIQGERADYSIHLGSGVVHLQGGPMVNVLPVHSQHRGRLFLPFVDEDPKTAQIISEILLFAEDKKIKDPFILEQIR